MTRVYGNQIEPEGMELAEEWETMPCPKCNKEATGWYCERLEGGAINSYTGLRCYNCKYYEGEYPDDDGWPWDKDLPYDPKEEAYYDLLHAIDSVRIESAELRAVVDVNDHSLRILYKRRIVQSERMAEAAQQSNSRIDLRCAMINEGPYSYIIEAIAPQVSILAKHGVQVLL